MTAAANPAVVLSAGRLPAGTLPALVAPLVAAVLGGAVLWGVAAFEEPPPVTLADSLLETGLYADPVRLVVDHGHIAFSPQYPLWTDGATKRRWISLPEGGAIDASDPDDWEFPVGTRIWKEFSFSGRPVETRYMERLPDGEWVLATYAWSGDGADARLVGAAGRPGAHPLGDGRSHSIPGTADCRACHRGQPSPVLGFSALQLSGNRDGLAPHAEPGMPGTDLEALVARGIVRGLPLQRTGTTPAVAAATPMERAAVGYLHGNCGHCHNREGPLRSLGLFLRHEIGGAGMEPAVATTLGVPVRRLGAGERVRIAAGEPDGSFLLERAASREPSLQMPPLGTAVPDRNAIALLRDWITELETTEPHGDFR